MTLTLATALLVFCAVMVPARRRPALMPRRPVGRRAGPDRSRSAAAVPVELDTAGVAELAERVAALSRAGLPPQRVWSVLAASPTGGPPDRGSSGSGSSGRGSTGVAVVVARVLALGGTEGQGLRAAGGGVGPLAWLALACDVSHVSGAPLAQVLDGIADTLRAEQEAGREREVALAGPRTTATVLSWLPLAGVGLGLMTGVDAVSALVTTGPGRACLVTAGALWAGGRWWMSRMVRAAEAIDPGSRAPSEQLRPGR